MYELNRKYKIELKKGLFFTGIILKEDSISIRIKTIRDEDMIINKSEIIKSKVLVD